MKRSYIIYDLEATCWLGRPPKGINEIIEIGALRVNEYGEIVDKFEQFVKPSLNPLLSGFCKKLTSISQDQVNTARVFPKVFNDFLEWSGYFECECFMCSWGSNDKKLFLDECRLHKLDLEWLDTLRNLKSHYDNLKGHSVTGTLKRITQKEGFEFTGKAHRAISDAENLTKIFLKYFDEWILE